MLSRGQRVPTPLGASRRRRQFIARLLTAKAFRFDQSWRVWGVLPWKEENEVKTRAARRIVGSPQTTAMRFNYGAADGQSHADPMRLRGKEGVEDLVRLLRGQPHAGIADTNHKLLLSWSVRLDGEFTRPIHILHRIDAVHHEVHHDLLQLPAIPPDLRKICRQLHPYRYDVSRDLAAQKDDQFLNNFVDINQLPLRSTLLAEQTDPADDFRRTCSVFHDSRGTLARLF